MAYLENKDLINALEDTIYVSEKELAQSSSTVKKMMDSSKILNEINNGT